MTTQLMLEDKRKNGIAIAMITKRRILTARDNITRPSLLIAFPSCQQLNQSKGVKKMRDDISPFPPSFEGVRQLVSSLRSQEGCPWDREQTPKTLAPMLIEECHELVEAIENGDVSDIIEEIGDVLFHMAFQLQIGKSEGLFTDCKVFKSVNEKYVRRHPHVFGNEQVGTIEELKGNWDRIKKIEKKGIRKSAIDGIPNDLPALAYADSIQKRASRTGFDWDDPDKIKDKVLEELDEIYAARNHDEKQEEFGDLLFSIVNAARRMNIDSEQALRSSNRKFRKRFTEMESDCRKNGIDFTNLTLEEKDELWNKVKGIEL